MKSRFSKVAVLSAFILTSPLLIFAAGQPKLLRVTSRSEMQNRAGATRAVPQGKGSGMTRNHAAIPAVTGRSQTAPNLDDSALRK
jgi:hypothetical protein